MAAKNPLPIVPADLRDLFDQRPIVFGEKPQLYDTLRSRVALAVKPKDVIEWLYIKDVVDLTWEIQRLRGFQAAIVDDQAKRTLAKRLDSERFKHSAFKSDHYGVPPEDSAVARAYFAGDSKAKKEVAELLKDQHYIDDREAMIVAAFVAQVPTLELVSRMLTSAEARRDRILREIERHRQNFGACMRGVLSSEKGAEQPSSTVLKRRREHLQISSNEPKLKKRA